MQSFAERQIARLRDDVFQRVSPQSRSGNPRAWSEVLAEALEEPVGGDFPDARRIVVVISDRTRDEPRGEFLSAVQRRFPRAALRVLIASGTHQPDPGALPEAFASLPLRAHDAIQLEATTELGTTRRGTRVRLAKELLDADLVLCTGRLRPHYFAGYSGGVKGVFPGCAFREDILRNHLLKAEAGARLGVLDDNPCRADMEEAALMLGERLRILNVLADVDGKPVAAASGHPVLAHRRLAAQADELFRAEVRPSRVLVVADRPPLSKSLYQASKMLAVAEQGLLPHGTVILVADCSQGTGPLDRVNEGIFELGLKPRLPVGADVRLVSELPRERVGLTYAAFAESLEAELARLNVGSRDPATLVWRAGECVPRLPQP